jgi:hypothetical protein
MASVYGTHQQSFNNSAYKQFAKYVGKESKACDTKPNNERHRTPLGFLFLISTITSHVTGDGDQSNDTESTHAEPLVTTIRLFFRHC